MVILKTEEYEEITNFIQNYKNGATIDCEKELNLKYPHLDAFTLGSILSTFYQTIIRGAHYRILSDVKKIIKEYENCLKNVSDHYVILNIAIKLNFSPISLARIMLTEIYKKGHSKLEISEMLKNPNLIPDPILSCNVFSCLFNDNLDGQITDSIRRYAGEEYEIKLKNMAKEAGILFYDENDLRRTGFDKTPDLKLAVPCLFRNRVIHWIESKAVFADIKTHQKYIREQLSSYSNRFGCGIVIYWHGYQDVVENCSDNNDLIIVMDSFPKLEELELLKFDGETGNDKTD